jgi:hypothetical protein
MTLEQVRLVAVVLLAAVVFGGWLSSKNLKLRGW